MRVEYEKCGKLKAGPSTFLKVGISSLFSVTKFTKRERERAAGTSDLMTFLLLSLLFSLRFVLLDDGCSSSEEDGWFSDDKISDLSTVMSYTIN